jgi:ABC-type Fe3+/spermidine/putrescine transport system ATPase subunit
MVRPEDIKIVKKGIIQGKVIDTVYKGMTYTIMIKSKNHIIMCQSLQHINTNTKVGLT